MSPNDLTISDDEETARNDMLKKYAHVVLSHIYIYTHMLLSIKYYAQVLLILFCLLQLSWIVYPHLPVVETELSIAHSGTCWAIRLGQTSMYYTQADISRALALDALPL